MTQAIVDSPIGPLRISTSARGICEVSFGARDRAQRNGRPQGLVLEAARQLQGYFAGKRTTFDLPLDFGTAPAFSKAVWRRIAQIPHGATIAYSEIAERLGRPRASRAVGRATGANPIPIIVPCHRVIGKDGSLTGFGGGMDRKRWLLRHEGAI